jgi:hypothetical protein
MPHEERQAARQKLSAFNRGRRGFGHPSPFQGYKGSLPTTIELQGIPTTSGLFGGAGNALLCGPPFPFRHFKFKMGIAPLAVWRDHNQPRGSGATRNFCG